MRTHFFSWFPFRALVPVLVCCLLIFICSVPHLHAETGKIAGSSLAYGKNGLPAGQPRFTDNGDGTVTDNRSGLVWLKDAECLGMHTWQEAKQAAAELSDGYICKEFELSDKSTPGDWRVPTIREIMTLPVIEYFSPALSNSAGTGKWTEGDPFINVSSLYYWSGTRVGENNGWYMYLYNGVLGLADISQKYHVWPVKGELKHLWRLGS